MCLNAFLIDFAERSITSGGKGWFGLWFEDGLDYLGGGGIVCSIVIFTIIDRGIVPI
jgi:hypothetical protein